MTLNFTLTLRNLLTPQNTEQSWTSILRTDEGKMHTKMMGREAFEEGKEHLLIWSYNLWSMVETVLWCGHVWLLDHLLCCANDLQQIFTASCLCLFSSLRQNQTKKNTNTESLIELFQGFILQPVLSTLYRESLSVLLSNKKRTAWWWDTSMSVKWHSIVCTWLRTRVIFRRKWLWYAARNRAALEGR